MPNIMWPLEANTIRKNSVSNTFGMVRNGGKRAHQGWDLLAYPGTACYAIADGTVRWAQADADFGRLIVVEFEHRGRTLFAAYAHLSSVLVKLNDLVVAGQLIGRTGNTGNAETMAGDDQHLHFEVRTIKRPGHGLAGRIDPKEVYGFVPLNFTIYDSRPAGKPASMSSPGLKVPGMNVL